MKKIIPLLLLLCLIACVNKHEASDKLKELYSSRNIVFDKDTEFCIVLPEVGCSGCISGCVYKILKYKKQFDNTQKKNLIVFTSINSMKMLRRNMEVDNLSEFNCIIDSLGMYLPEGNENIYPLFIRLKDGEISDAITQSPDTNTDIFSEWNIICK